MKSKWNLFLQAEGSSPKKAGSIYEFTAKDIDGNDVSLSKYQGHVCVIVNVASKWGKTDVNYKQLVEMYNNVSLYFFYSKIEEQILYILDIIPLTLTL